MCDQPAVRTVVTEHGFNVRAADAVLAVVGVVFDVISFGVDVNCGHELHSTQRMVSIGSPASVMESNAVMYTFQ